MDAESTAPAAGAAALVRQTVTGGWTQARDRAAARSAPPPGVQHGTVIHAPTVCDPTIGEARR
ncbi:hypothetical protein ACFS5L_01150 [Streptomyces phyllanthi]|uniref:Uncharacterized protein n=1 Tax=Streptomyces phyllanthi TaxID=1803180 RepID=A0A5N8W9Y3_9ACTN|nr:hypothetical protein [Streptomyces phyllanthi]MPY43932.1 hypothetical protein [Streptomyces phyllanthi]